MQKSKLEHYLLLSVKTANRYFCPEMGEGFDIVMNESHWLIETRLTILKDGSF